MSFLKGITNPFQPVSPLGGASLGFPRLGSQAEAVRDAREALKAELRQRRPWRRNETGSAQKLWGMVYVYVYVNVYVCVYLYIYIHSVLFSF